MVQSDHILQGTIFWNRTLMAITRQHVTYTYLPKASATKYADF